LHKAYVIYLTYDKLYFEREDAKEIYDSKTLRLSVVAPLRSKKNKFRHLRKNGYFILISFLN